MASPDSPKATPRRVRPLDALRGIRALLRDPDDTAKVFDIIDALAGRAIEHSFRRLRSTETGRRLIAERPRLVETLSDRERLLSMPVGSLGRCYAEFVGRENLSASGLADASAHVADRRQEAMPEEFVWFTERLRDTHDLWHVATGYNRDLVGEASLLAFSYAQTRNRGIGFIVLVAYLRAGRQGLTGARAMIREGYRRGKAAAWLPGQDWEALLARPLAEVRHELGLGDPPVYEEVRSEGAPAPA